jgi:hypothetical protein
VKLDLKKIASTIFLMDDQPQNEQGPSWKFRRTLIFGAYRLGFAMIVFGGVMFLVDQFGVGVALITGGVSLISIILTAYTATATFEDVKLYKSNEEMEP